MSNEPPKPSGTELLQALIAVQKRQAEILAHHEQFFDRLMTIGYSIRMWIVLLGIIIILIIPTCRVDVPLTR
jgi:hypothetical protein